MSPPFIVAVAVAGLLAGMINAAIGSGSLLTFPMLLAAGYSPLVANVSSTVGLIFGSFSGSFGYRRELAGQGHRVLQLGGFALVGGLTGAFLLLLLPASIFRGVVPVLVLFAVALVIAQPWLAAALEHRRGGRAGTLALRAGVFATGVYGGYFGAAQGVLLIGILGVLIADRLQRLNGLKTMLATIINGTASVVFVILAPVAWQAVLVLGATSLVGGQLGAHVGRRLPPRLLRGLIVVGGTAVVVKLLVFST
ncbi:MAG: sulfite exporter TauE/SafE family protein [Candidatus Dormibacteria bacterium]